MENRNEAIGRLVTIAQQLTTRQINRFVDLIEERIGPNPDDPIGRAADAIVDVVVEAAGNGTDEPKAGK